MRRRAAAPAFPDLDSAHDALSAADAMHELLDQAVAQGASDLHLRTSLPPVLRVRGELGRLESHAPFTAERLRAMLSAIMPPRNRDQFSAGHDTDFAYDGHASHRFRVNVFRDREGPGAVIRLVATTIITADELGLSDEIKQ